MNWLANTQINTFLLLLLNLLPDTRVIEFAFYYVSKSYRRFINYEIRASLQPRGLILKVEQIQFELHFEYC